jgi:hypothetical protein
MSIVLKNLRRKTSALPADPEDPAGAPLAGPRADEAVLTQDDLDLLISQYEMLQAETKRKEKLLLDGIARLEEDCRSLRETAERTRAALDAARREQAESAAQWKQREAQLAARIRELESRAAAEPAAAPGTGKQKVAAKLGWAPPPQAAGGSLLSQAARGRRAP